MPIPSLRRAFATFCLLLAGTMLPGCIVAPKQVFDPTTHGNIRSIALTNIEYNKKIIIQRYNPLLVLMGSSGLLMQEIAQQDRTFRYMARIGDFAARCKREIRRQLRNNLERQGYKVLEPDMDFWPAMKAARAHKLPNADAILRIRVQSLGYRSGGLSSPYRPAIKITARLVDASSRKNLYENTVAIGYKASNPRISILKLPPNEYRYPKLNNLLAHADGSTGGILQAMSMAVGRIAADLRQPMETSPYLAESEKAIPFPR